MISASLVKDLREKTGAGMMDCKKALVETNGNIEEAITWLRERGIAKAAKKADRIAAEGICKCMIDGNKAVIFELNSETDFVAKNQIFQDLAEKIGSAILKSNAKNSEEALLVNTDEGTVNDLVIAGTARIGEKLSLRRVQVIEKSDSQVFGTYSHMQGRIVVLDVLEGDNQEVAKDICMHVAAMNPLYLDETKVDSDFIANETHIAMEETKNDPKNANKPEAVMAKIVEGKIKKYLKTICLADQMFVKNQDITVGQYASGNKCSIVSYIRLEVGEGIEKRQDDFVAEVMAAVNN